VGHDYHSASIASASARYKLCICPVDQHPTQPAPKDVPALLVRSKVVVATLHKGDAFGDLAILDGARRSTAVAPLSASATLMVVERADFLTMLGTHFRAVRETMRAFLAVKVSQ